MGQLPPGAVTLIETAEEARTFEPADPERLSFVTQTTLSLDDAAEIVAVLKGRFPGIEAPVKEDICYATTNRQEAIKTMASRCDLVLVVGSKTSSNSLRLVEVAKRAGARAARLIDDALDIDWSWLRGVGVLDALSQRFEVQVEEAETVRETVSFKLPRVLAD